MPGSLNNPVSWAKTSCPTSPKLLTSLSCSCLPPRTANAVGLNVAAAKGKPTKVAAGSSSLSRGLY